VTVNSSTVSYRIIYDGAPVHATQKINFNYVPIFSLHSLAWTPHLVVAPGRNSKMNVSNPLLHFPIVFPVSLFFALEYRTHHGRCHAATVHSRLRFFFTHRYHGVPFS